MLPQPLNTNVDMNYSVNIWYAPLSYLASPQKETPSSAQLGARDDADGRQSLQVVAGADGKEKPISELLCRGSSSSSSSSREEAKRLTEY